MARGPELATTWWARRWMAALDGFGWAGRLSRGRSYARNGRVLDVEFSRGAIRARVQGSERQPYRVEMSVERFPDQVWDRVIGALARQALYAAKLLAGELPAEIVQLCDTAEAPLFPSHPNDITMKCSCPDWAVPCKHVAAVHYALAAELDRDPFLLFRLRGRTREELTAALRARRSSFGSAGAARMAAESQAAAETKEPEAEPLPVEQFWTIGAELEGLHFEIREPDVPGAVLRLLGRPPGWGGQDELLASLHDLYRVASASVRDVALADVEEEADEHADELSAEDQPAESQPAPASHVER
ncbi:MAG: SWIM zinc finger family protein [Chloroflexota bacterium]